MKFLIDQALPYGAEEALRLRGFDAVHARSAGLATSSDEEIVQWCRANGRVVVTTDADFPAIVALAGASDPSVIRIRMQGLGAEEVAEMVARATSAHRTELTAGALITIRAHSTRVRILPVIELEEEA